MTMNEEQLRVMRKRLEDERANMQSDIDTLTIGDMDEGDSNGVSNHAADDASDLTTRERNMALNNNAADIIAQIDAALRRMDEGRYGICELSGRQIPLERLEAIPYAAYDIESQALIERERGEFGSTTRV